MRNGYLVPHRDSLFNPIEETFNTFFDNFTSDLSGKKLDSKFPKLDLLEQDGKAIVRVAVSGMSKDDINVELEEIPSLSSKDDCTYQLNISGQMSVEHTSSNATFHVKELKHSSFKRSVSMPDIENVDPEVTMKDGILTLIWPLKKHEEKIGSVKKISLS